jgi:hypothetical protein
MIFLPYPLWNVFAGDGHLRSAGNWRKAPRHFYLACKDWIVGFEHDEMDDLLVRHQFQETPFDHIGVFRSLAAGRLIPFAVG